MASALGAARKVLRGAAWVIIPALVVASIWLPVLLHYRIPEPQISALSIAQARLHPPQALLEDLKGERLLTHGWTDCEVVGAAENLLRGEFTLSPASSVPFHLPFAPENLTAGSLVTQLYVAGLAPADFLLRAYECTGEERYFAAARALIAGFAAYERRAWLPRGFLWHDHAAANRIFVLADFWRLYRVRPDFDRRTARMALTLAARSAEWLTRPRHFAFHGNHGVMQNVGLLRSSLAFPTMPRAAAHRRLAMRRFDEQLPFYVSDEGVVLEHSASYQYMGVDLLRRIIRDVRLLGLDVPAAWDEKLRRATEYAAQLPRPDGTLPTYGDTRWSERWVDPLAGRPGAVPPRPLSPVSVNPVGGYVIWWDGLEHWPDARRLRQTVLTFSYFPGHLHKHADELSVVLWAGGQVWWTNVGYWPFDRPERAQAVSWAGSNAPHLLDEPTGSARTARLLAHGVSRTAIAADVVREGPAGYRARRQVVHVKPDHWLVIDAVSGAPGRTSLTRWTAGSGVSVLADERGGPRMLRREGIPARLLVSFSGSSGTTVRPLTSTLGPFIREGIGADATMAQGVEVTQPGEGSWVAAAWILDPTGAAGSEARAVVTRWRTPEEWTARVSFGLTALEIAREGPRLVIRGTGGEETVALEGVDAEPGRRAIVAAFGRTARTYPRFPWRLRFRRWGTVTLAAVAAAQELVFLGIGRRAAMWYRPLRMLTLAVWIAGGVLLGLLLGW